jgi:two-component system sensor histidine kinase CiaH
MIGKLRKKFILVMMLSLLIVMSILVGAINIVYAEYTKNQVYSTIQVLHENSGAFPELPDGGKGNPSGGSSPEKTSGTDMATASDMHGGKMRLNSLGITPDTRFETSFFTVVLNSDGTIKSINHGFIASVTESDITSYVTSIVNSGKTNGKIDYFRYQVFTESDGTSTIVAVSCYQQLRQANTILLVSVGAGVLCMAAVFVLVLLMSRRVTKPVEESVEKQRQFITDAGHELKTPITIISANTEVLQMQVGENQWVDSIKNQTRRLNSLVKSLLELSKMDEMPSADQFSEFDLSAAVTEAAEAFQVPAEAAGIEFVTDIQPDIKMNGSRDELFRLATILLDNALKYSDGKGPIKVSLSRQKKIALSVYNTCEHVDRDKLDRLFERFYRADESRSRQTGGSGIGLSIANAITERHKGRISASTEDEKSITFTAVF